jgi:beta-glucosidase
MTPSPKKANSMGFPEQFIWGAATASYQIEGAVATDGKGPSVWDKFCSQPQKIWSGHTGDVACDHYYRSAEDIQLMSDIGLSAYRLSISWPRVLPEGTGHINPNGLAFYDQLIDGLLEHHIQPWVTLFHWDFPYALYCQGGWLNRASADWFADYTAVVVDKLSDRVAHWITLNEPQCFLGLGHQSGEHAPGLKLGFADILLASHHALLAHGKAVQVIRARAHLKPEIGLAQFCIARIPATASSEDVQAAQKSMFAIAGKHCWNNTWFADPIFRGHYPQDGVQLFQSAMPVIQADDLAIIAQPLDFFGVNIYYGQTIRAQSGNGFAGVAPVSGYPMTTMDWEVTPEALYWGPKFLYDRYQLPIVVTENGVAINDWVHVDGQVHDPQRIDFLTRYLRAYGRAIADGIEAKGYFLWSMMDNFEWAHGYKQRFGLIYVDYSTQQRFLKDSALWYRRVITSNGEILAEVESQP